MQELEEKFSILREIPAGTWAQILTQKASKGEVVFQENDPPAAVYFLTRGLVKSCKFSSRDDPSTIDFIVPGQFFGMIAVLEDRSYPVNAEALRDSEFLRFPAAVFRHLLRQFPLFSQTIFRQVGFHLRNSQTLRAMIQEPVEKRMAHILSYLLETMGSDLTVLREDLAAMAGCTTSTAVRVVIDFRKKKIVSTGWKKIKILAPEKLKALAG